MRLPCKQSKAVARDTVEERFHHDPAEYERRDKADRDQNLAIRAELRAAFVRVIGKFTEG
jgi:hypothetical protein